MNKEEFKELDREQMIIAFNQLKDDYSSLFDELEQEKEKNKELQKYKEYYQEMEEVNKKFIAEGKIQAKIFELENSDSLEDSIAIPYLKKLLEEK